MMNVLNHKANRMMKKLGVHKQEGFTLLEMIVVLFILGLLILLFLPNIMNQRDSAQKTGDEALIQTVETQKILYKNDHDGQEGTIDQLVAEEYLSQEQADRFNAISTE
ncbi:MULTISPECIES: competence type IV pilus major pilin ComGC [Aerococcus]|uniref:competence type IV pilus major pilin ComGC n=1 Tax=Aerococcus TaxID=1375 RepID=UPI001E39AEB3|nr:MULTISPECIES: competence type IV pilus major pilin ComGC [Aerococcus]MCY3036101.1 competence type IV pilus major pilin ComGC [Aerococcus sp. Group 2]MCY3040057.1 competence type IV pilus major pilin ComGC [Aerococcus sp. Group 2]MCY3040771.1 competence type IV pilus major pilin ComGC [Aerococcus sp. Group 2]MCY3042763.1 competence type IV pilus major pilin ComGC [Aerococcus sp. Group 2]MDK6520908.1 competence type IV pilus major pilin ComGC [Aerococcus urinae]